MQSQTLPNHPNPSQLPHRTDNAAYQRELAHNKSQQFKSLKAKRFQKLVEYAKPLKEALKKYRPDYVPPKPKAEPKPAPRKRWILGVD